MVSSENQRGKKNTKRLDRGTLTPALIVEAALRILDRDSSTGLTFSRLGRELGASPTAMYRHFPDRESILDAVGDRLIEESLHGYEPAETWQESLRNLAWRAWHTYAKHPSAASITYFRVTRRPNELRAVDAILQALSEAGLPLESAALAYHMYSQLVLSHAAANASRIANMQSDSIETNTSFWEQVYEPADPSEYPHYWEARDLVRATKLDEVFETLLEMFIDYVRKAAADPAHATSATQPDSGGPGI